MNSFVSPVRVACLFSRVDVREVTLHHAKRNSRIIGNLFERALVASHGAQHVGLAWCEAVSGDEFRLQLFGGRRAFGGEAGW